MEFVTADPDTLLARLNTRRLSKRLQDKTDYTYPSNMTTDEIALVEWNDILKRATRQATSSHKPRRSCCLPSFLQVANCSCLHPVHEVSQSWHPILDREIHSCGVCMKRLPFASREVTCAVDSCLTILWYVHVIYYTCICVVVNVNIHCTQQYAPYITFYPIS